MTLPQGVHFVRQRVPHRLDPTIGAILFGGGGHSPPTITPSALASLAHTPVKIMLVVKVGIGKRSGQQRGQAAFERWEKGVLDRPVFCRTVGTFQPVCVLPTLPPPPHVCGRRFPASSPFQTTHILSVNFGQHPPHERIFGPSPSVGGRTPPPDTPCGLRKDMGAYGKEGVSTSPHRPHSILLFNSKFPFGAGGIFLSCGALRGGGGGPPGGVGLTSKTARGVSRVLG